MLHNISKSLWLLTLGYQQVSIREDCVAKRKDDVRDDDRQAEALLAGLGCLAFSFDYKRIEKF